MMPRSVTMTFCFLLILSAQPKHLFSIYLFTYYSTLVCMIHSGLSLPFLFLLLLLFQILTLKIKVKLGHYSVHLHVIYPVKNISKSSAALINYVYANSLFLTKTWSAAQSRTPISTIGKTTPIIPIAIIPNANIQNA